MIYSRTMKGKLAYILWGMLAILVYGCHITRDLIRLSDEEHYNFGLKKFEKGRYSDARKDFEKVCDDFPASEYAPLSLLKVADSYFYERSYSEAAAEYKSFIELYPAHKDASYASYQLCLSRYERILTIDRDQTNTYEAIGAIKQHLLRYPDLNHSAQLALMLEDCYNRLAEHNFYIGKFYFKRKKYDAALRRFQKVIEEYPEYKYKGEVWFYMGESYYAKKELKEAKIAYQKALNLGLKKERLKVKIDKRLKDLDKL